MQINDSNFFLKIKVPSLYIGVYASSKDLPFNPDSPLQHFRANRDRRAIRLKRPCVGTHERLGGAPPPYTPATEKHTWPLPSFLFLVPPPGEPDPLPPPSSMVAIAAPPTPLSSHVERRHARNFRYRLDCPRHAPAPIGVAKTPNPTELCPAQS